MEFFENISLKKLNTFGLDVKTKYFVEITDTAEIPYLLESKIFNENKRFILGAGSNVLFTQDYNGLIVNMSNRGIRILDEIDDYVLIEAGAGEFWDEFVRITLKNGHYGLENLALIPGKIGAAPIQNIGAYGTEQKDFLHSVKGFNIENRKYIELFAKDCDFSYRNSIFKNELNNNFIVTSVVYRLSKVPNVKIDYRDIKKEIENYKIKNPDPHYIYDCISKIRRNKLPEVSAFGNVGSYFKNPIITKECFSELRENYNDIPFFEMEENIKIPAAWLIERCDLKGKIKNGVGIWNNHSLVLVNYGTAKPNDIINLANEIKDKVFQKFSINLVEEVILI